MSASKNFTVTPGPAITLDSGAPAGQMETVKVDPENPHNARLIEAGRLVENADQPELTAEQVIATVGDDAELAERYLADEKSGKERKTVIEALEAVISKENA